MLPNLEIWLKLFNTNTHHFLGKGEPTKNFCHAYQILAKGGGLVNLLKKKEICDNNLFSNSVE